MTTLGERLGSPKEMTPEDHRKMTHEMLKGYESTFYVGGFITMKSLKNTQAKTSSESKNNSDQSKK